MWYFYRSYFKDGNCIQMWSVEEDSINLLFFFAFISIDKLKWQSLFDTLMVPNQLYKVEINVNQLYKVRERLKLSLIRQSKYYYYLS